MTVESFILLARDCFKILPWLILAPAPLYFNLVPWHFLSSFQKELQMFCCCEMAITFLNTSQRWPASTWRTWWRRILSGLTVMFSLAFLFSCESIHIYIYHIYHKLLFENWCVRKLMHCQETVLIKYIQEHPGHLIMSFSLGRQKFDVVTVVVF